MLFFVLALNSRTYAQPIDPVDSLTLELKKSIHDANRIQILIELGDYYESSEPDKALEYYHRAADIAKQSDGDNREIQDLLITATRYIGIVHNNQNAFDKAMDYFMQSLRMSEKQNNKSGIAASLNNIGMVHGSLRNYDLSIDYHQRSLDLSSELKDTFSIARAHNNLGVAYSNKKEIHLAITNYEKAAEAFGKLGHMYHLAAISNNIGTYYLNLIHSDEMPDSTEAFYYKSLQFFQKSMPVFREMDEQYDLATTLANLAQTHVQLYTLHDKDHPQREQHFKKAVKYGTESIDLSNRIRSFNTIYFSASALKELYKTIGDHSTALKYSELINSNNDSLFILEKDRTITEIETQYQTEKKEQEIERQKLEASRSRIIRNTLIAGFLLMLLLAVSFYRGYINKQQANQLISEQNSILEQANSEIQAQRDELEAQRDLVVEQNDRLEIARANMNDSLQYAQSIQAAILPSEGILKGISPDYFMFIKPCELVSGDFFWALSFEEYKVFGVADCTGHGVPGAFMSILGINALNDIVVGHRVFQPNQILNHLRENVINALGQNDPDQKHKDGIDIALCTFNIKTRILQYAGARLPLWMVVEEAVPCAELEGNSVKSVISLNGYKMLELKPDNMPAGQSPRMKPFTMQTISLADCSANLYMITDGFMDQFGGEKYSKYGTLQLKNLILQNCTKPFPQQKSILEEEFEGWKGGNYQVDDATVLGIKI